MTTGGGGMLVTDNETWARRAKYLTTQARDSETEYIHESIGYNYRLTNLQAAVGVAQLERLDEYIGIKRHHAAYYRARLQGVDGLVQPPEAPWAFSTFWLYAVLVHEKEFGLSSRALTAQLKSRGIECRPLWMPMHMTPVYKAMRRTSVDVSEQLYHQAVCLPSSVGLTQDDQRQIVEIISKDDG